MKFIFSLGLIDKKLLLPIIYTINDVILNAINYIFELNKIPSFQIADSIGIGLGAMSTFLIPYVFKYKNADNKKKCTKENCKFISILVIYNLVYYVVISSSTLTADTSSEESTTVADKHVKSLFTIEAFEIIMITIITFIFLKYKYYTHHIISLIIFCSLSLVIDTILNNYTEGLLKKKVHTIILDLLSNIFELANFCLLTYLMRIKFYHYWTLSFVLGCIMFSLNILALLGCVSFGDPNGDRSNFFNEFYYYFKEVNPGIIILRILSQFIFQGFGMILIRILILDNLSPNHILLSYEISKILVVLTAPNLDNKWISLIPIAFQLMSLLFYLEIFEYNFCNLNRNTKRNIQSREEIDMFSGRESLSSQDIIIADGYSIDKNDVNAKFNEKKESKEGNRIESEIELQCSHTDNDADYLKY